MASGKGKGGNLRTEREIFFSSILLIDFFWSIHHDVKLFFHCYLIGYQVKKVNKLGGKKKTIEINVTFRKYPIWIFSSCLCLI